MNFHQEILVLFQVTVLDVTYPTDCHKVTDVVSGFAAAHPSTVYVVNVNGFCSAYFTRYKSFSIEAEVFKVDFRVVFHSRSL